MAEQPTLPSFEDLKVNGSRVRITKAGDGLSDALDVRPVAMHIGEVTHYVVRTVVRQVNHREDPRTNAILRIHTVEVLAISEIDSDIADKAIKLNAEQVERLRAEQAGQQMMEIEAAAEAKEADD